MAMVGLLMRIRCFLFMKRAVFDQHFRIYRLEDEDAGTNAEPPIAQQSAIEMFRR